VVRRTEGVTASFIKELLRRALIAVEGAESGDAAQQQAPQRLPERGWLRVTDRHLHSVLDVLLGDGNALTRRLLGAGGNRCAESG
jgi:hypothetical protein